MLSYRPSSMSTTFSGRGTLSVSGSMKTRKPLAIPDVAKIKGGRKSQTSSSSMRSGAREPPIRQTPQVKPIPDCLHGNKTMGISCRSTPTPNQLNKTRFPHLDKPDTGFDLKFGLYLRTVGKSSLV